MTESSPPKKLALDALWRARTSKFADFAGADMPIQFDGLIAEHNWTRQHAGLFDVSHMGPCFFALPKGHAKAARFAARARRIELQRQRAR